MAKSNKTSMKKQKQTFKHEEKMKKLENQGSTGYGARKMANLKERQKTLRTTAIANSISGSAKAFADSKRSQNEALNKWNTLINGAEDPGNNKQGDDTSDTTKYDGSGSQYA